MNRLISLLLAGVASGAAAQFSPPVVVTDGSAKHQLTRNPRGVLQVDAGGVVHLAYWSGTEATTPETPSHVFHVTRSLTGEFGAAAGIDDSQAGGEHLGGRQPSLALLPGGRAILAWHDHRHTTLLGGYIDNLEIYADRQDMAGQFSPIDERLTTTSAAHNGDNGYLPRMAVDAAGAIHLVWYDFNAEPGVSDIYYRVSAPDGAFAAGESLGDWRLTNKDDRDPAAPFTVPDITLEADGSPHFVWLQGTTVGLDVFHASTTAPGVSATYELVSAGTGSFFDPPKILTMSNDDVWIVATDGTAPSGGDVQLLRRAASGIAFDPAIVVPTTGARLSHPCAVPDSADALHLVYVEHGASRTVLHRSFDPSSSTFSEQAALTNAAGNWTRPTVAIDGSGQLHAAFEEEVSSSSGRIWYTTTATPLSAASWRHYP